MSGLATGSVNKYLGPGREKTPMLQTFFLMTEALGLAVKVVEDPEAVRRMRGRWSRRREEHVRPPEKVSKIAIRRAKRIVIAELARRGAGARWAGMSPDQRREHIEVMNIGRALKRLAGKSEAA